MNDTIIIEDDHKGIEDFKKRLAKKNMKLRTWEILGISWEWRSSGQKLVFLFLNESMFLIN